MKPPAKYCAVYTRKSSEEGLEQDFNSLDAQREACLAYIASQKSEGWTTLKEHYDDGGYSGGNMERPGLKQLQEDIKAGKVNIVVVYKIDRLTRSLMDFAKLVEIFDKHGVTFVSVTQSFNTTTSMGRLTLNVLLSFAQFEREVTGERIRDKIAASKKKGMWMGGARPTGYDIINKHLVVRPDEAEIVQVIFEKYLAFGCVRRLKEYLEKAGIKTKQWISKKGNTYGGAEFSRGILYKILTNPVYIGKVPHKGQLYNGQHKAIITQDLWDRVQKRMVEGSPSGRGQKKSAAEENILQGRLFDYHGNFYSPIFTSRAGKQYRYYISQAMLQDRRVPSDIIARIPAHDIETLVERSLREHLASVDKASYLLGVDVAEGGDILAEIVRQNKCLDLQNIVANGVFKIVIHPKSVSVIVQRGALRDCISNDRNIAVPDNKSMQAIAEISIPFEPIRSKRSFMVPAPDGTVKDLFDIPASKLKTWIKGVTWRQDHFAGMSMTAIAERENCSLSFVSKLIFQSFETG